MEKIKQFLENYLLHIICFLFILIWINNCSQQRINNRLVKQNKELVNQLSVIKDSLVSKTYLKEELYKEGLRVEKRMIQSTDRKILDVKRQTEIDRELSNLK